MADREQGRRPENRPCGTTRTPGWHPEEKATLVTATQLTEVLSNQRGLRPRTPKGRAPRTLASWRHWLLRVVAATAGAWWIDGRGTSTYVLAFFVYSRHPTADRTWRFLLVSSSRKLVFIPVGFGAQTVFVRICVSRCRSVRQERSCLMWLLWFSILSSLRAVLVTAYSRCVRDFGIIGMPRESSTVFLLRR